MDFGSIKEKYMKRLEEAKKKGLVDEPIIPLLDLINSFDYFFSTSSCAGRIILISVHPSWKKNLSKIFFKSHYQVDPEEAWEALTEGANVYKNLIYLKQEPFILHVSIKSLDKALELLSLVQKIGLKHSGILSVSQERVNLEVQSVERVDALLAKDGVVLAPKEYFKELIYDANYKLKKTREKMDRLFVELKERKIKTIS